MLLHDLLAPFCSQSVRLSATQNSLSVKSYGRFNVIRSSDLLFTAYNLFVSFSKLFLCQTVNYRIDRTICYPSVRHEKVNVSLKTVVSLNRVQNLDCKCRCPADQKCNQYGKKNFRHFDFGSKQFLVVMVQRRLGDLSKMNAIFKKHFQGAKCHNWVRNDEQDKTRDKNNRQCVLISALANKAVHFTSMKTEFL